MSITQSANPTTAPITGATVYVVARRHDKLAGLARLTFGAGAAAAHEFSAKDCMALPEGFELEVAHIDTGDNLGADPAAAHCVFWPMDAEIANYP